VIWGLDLSLRHTGLVILNEEGAPIDAITIIPHKDSRGPKRWHEVVSQVADVLEKRRPRLVVIEGLGFRSHTLAMSAELSGIIRYFFFLQNIPYKLVAPTKLKSLIASKGNAKKEEMIAAIKKTYGYTFKDDHQADAFALAILAFENRID